MNKQVKCPLRYDGFIATTTEFLWEFTGRMTQVPVHPLINRESLAAV